VTTVIDREFDYGARMIGFQAQRGENEPFWIMVFNDISLCKIAMNDAKLVAPSRSAPSAPPPFAPTAPPPTTSVVMTHPFQDGLADRQKWETWFARTVGDFRSGAEYWAGHRSL